MGQGGGELFSGNRSRQLHPVLTRRFMSLSRAELNPLAILAARLYGSP